MCVCVRAYGAHIEDCLVSVEQCFAVDFCQKSPKVVHVDPGGGGGQSSEYRGQPQNYYRTLSCNNTCRNKQTYAEVLFVSSNLNSLLSHLQCVCV